LKELKDLLVDPEEIRHVPRILSECGVRFVVVEPLAGSKIDGACLWLGRRQNVPVIGMSLRYDRIDNFWFYLRHEIEHVLRGDGKETAILDADIEGSLKAAPESLSPEERAANTAAAEFCVPSAELDNFIARVRPIFAEQRVVLFAESLHVHAGIVVGQLQRRTERYDLLRKYLVKVREYLIGSAMTDGYGITLPTLAAT
jgi:HTH-type transcriptional regulator/antitoxin HigA